MIEVLSLPGGPTGPFPSAQTASSGKSAAEASLAGLFGLQMLALAGLQEEELPVVAGFPSPASADAGDAPTLPDLEIDLEGLVNGEVEDAADPAELLAVAQALAELPVVADSRPAQKIAQTPLLRSAPATAPELNPSTDGESTSAETAAQVAERPTPVAGANTLEPESVPRQDTPGPAQGDAPVPQVTVAPPLISSGAPSERPADSETTPPVQPDADGPVENSESTPERKRSSERQTREPRSEQSHAVTASMKTVDPETSAPAHVADRVEPQPEPTGVSPIAVQEKPQATDEKKPVEESVTVSADKTYTPKEEDAPTLSPRSPVRSPASFLPPAGQAKPGVLVNQQNAPSDQSEPTTEVWSQRLESVDTQSAAPAPPESAEIGAASTSFPQAAKPLVSEVAGRTPTAESRESSADQPEPEAVLPSGDSDAEGGAEDSGEGRSRQEQPRNQPVVARDASREPKNDKPVESPLRSAPPVGRPDARSRSESADTAKVEAREPRASTPVSSPETLVKAAQPTNVAASDPTPAATPQPAPSSSSAPASAPPMPIRAVEPVAATLPAAAPPAPERADPALQVAASEVRRSGDSTRLTVVLEDDRLGSLALRISERSGGVDVFLRADNPATAKQFQSNLPHLYESLLQRGLQPDSRAWTPSAAADADRQHEEQQQRERESRQQHRGRRERRNEDTEKFFFPSI